MKKIQELLEQFHMCPALDRVLPTTHGHDLDPERFVPRQPPGDAAPSESATSSDDLAWAKDC